MLAVIVAASAFYMYKKMPSDTPSVNQEPSPYTGGARKNDDAQLHPVDDNAPAQSQDIPKEQLPESVNPSTDIQEYTLIIENEKYKIRKAGDTYTITLYAIINNPSQYESYTQQLSQYKQEVLSYLNQKKVDTTKVKIIYEPEEAANL